MTIIRRDFNGNRRGGAFAKGRNAIAIDQRSGFKLLQRDMVFEPGTNYFVHKDESDGPFNLVTDKLNYVADAMRHPDRQALRFSSPEYPIAVALVCAAVTAGAVVSADRLYISSIPPSVNFIDYYPGTSATTD